MERLSLSNLSKAYSSGNNVDILADKGVGIVHLGFGAFHRAHQAYITDVLMKEMGGNWKIVGVNRGGGVSTVDVKSQLIPQDYLYTIASAFDDKLETYIVSAVEKVLNLSDDFEEVKRYLCSEEVKIVSLTITEKGYCCNPSTGRLDLSNSLIREDLKNLANPRTSIGLLVWAIKQRKEDGIEMFTPLSCDNLPSNGQTLRRVVLDFCKELNEEFYLWVKDNINFPCTMIDRIVPQTTKEDISRISATLGLRDEACVITEPFIQWIIEDNFVNERPLWERSSVGNIKVVKDVSGYEDMKLRLLNGTHSTMAYLGYLSGYRTISEVIVDNDFKNLIKYMMDKEIEPSLAEIDVDLEVYKRELIARYSNSSLKHLTWQIAMDGSQKLPQRLLNTIAYGLVNGISIEGVSLAVSSWIRYVKGVDELDNPIDVRDPMRERFLSIWESLGDDAEGVVTEFLGIREIFSEYLANSEKFRKILVEQLQSLLDIGAKRTVSNLVLRVQ